MTEQGLEESRAAEIKKQLHILKMHLKHDFRGHLSEKSSCLQHCINYALAERMCSEHEHTESCMMCDLVYTLGDQIPLELSKLNVTDDATEEELDFDIKASKERIIGWRNHCIRTVNQDSCKAKIIRELKYHEVLIISDWAMKYLPQTFRETQSDWFGKQGISWHVTCALLQNKAQPEENEGLDESSAKMYDIHSFIHIHVVENGSQGWHAVSQILTHVMHLLNEMNPELKDVYLKSDNAACYHCVPLMAYFWANKSNMKLNIKEYNFSEAQSGKDLCDSRAGTCRLHILNYINEGHDVTTATEMKEALESHGGIRNTHVNVISITSEEQPTLSGSLKLHISQYNNFIFDDNDGLRIFKAYGIGGEKVSRSDMDRISKNMVQQAKIQIVESSADPDQKKSSFRVNRSRQQSFPCSESECVKQFDTESQLLRHLAVGQHLYDSEENDTTLDTAKRIWAERCVSLRHNQPHISVGTINVEDAKFVENVGYALKKQRKNKRFSIKVKDYLSNLFELGEISGKKASPFTISKQMRNERDEAGSRMFTPSEWLTHQQIRGYFASLSLKKQKEGNLSKASVKRLKMDDIEEDEDLQSAINALVASEHSAAVSLVTSEIESTD